MLRVLAIWACIWICTHLSINGDTDADDVSALNMFYNSVNSPSQLAGWSANGGDPCGQSWKGVSCTDSSVTELKLSGLGLNGNLGYQLDKMKSLVELDVSNNNLGGGNPIPYNLPQSLQRLNLGQNQFNGGIPYSISQMSSLENLNLAHNQLQGALSDMFGQLSKLETMDLSFNFITGDLPESFSDLSSLETLHLQNNQFTGPIDALTNLPLDDLNVENNRFTGWIPNRLKEINNLQTGGNSWSTGPAPPPPPYTSPPGAPLTPDQGSGNNRTPVGDGGKSSGVSGGGIAGIVISILVVGAVIAFFLLKRKSRKFSREDNLEQDRPFTSFASHGINELKSIHIASAVDTAMFKPAPDTTTFQPSITSLRPPPTDRQNKSFDVDEFSQRMPKAKSVSIKATIYSVADLQIATNSFSVDNLVGEGSFGRVYRAQFADGKVLAVKKINSSSLPRHSSEGFIGLVSSISRLHHPNISELVGYCSEHGQNLLVYQFHKNGSLMDLLHLIDEDSSPLSWNNRVKIALGSSRALEYLHEVCSPSIVHKNFNSANILMDAELNPHLSDCGLSSLAPNADFQGSNHNQGSGYSSPEFTMSGQYTMKSDVYSFGVVMLELLTGRKPFDSSRPRNEQFLVRWATPQLHDIDALDKMVDPQLEGLYPAKSLSRFADIIALCVQPEPEFRPPMSEVVQALVRLVQRAKMNKRVLAGQDGREAQEE